MVVHVRVHINHIMCFLIYFWLIPSQNQLIDGVSSYNWVSCGNFCPGNRHPFRGQKLGAKKRGNSKSHPTRQQGEPEGEMHLPLLLFLAFRSLRSLATKFQRCFLALEKWSKKFVQQASFLLGKMKGTPKKGSVFGTYIYMYNMFADKNSEMFERMNKLL